MFQAVSGTNDAGALPIPAPNLGDGIPLTIFQFVVVAVGGSVGVVRPL